MISVRDTPRLTCNFVFSVVKTVKTNSNSHKEFYGIISGTRNSSCSLLMRGIIIATAILQSANVIISSSPCFGCISKYNMVRPVIWISSYIWGDDNHKILSITNYLLNPVSWGIKYLFPPWRGHKYFNHGIILCHISGWLPPPRLPQQPVLLSCRARRCLIRQFLIIFHFPHQKL